MQKSFLCLILSILLSTQVSIGQSMLHNIRYLTVENGLLGRRINSILQDDEGFIWLATNEGLNRFDGYEFQHFTQENFGLSSNQIEIIKKDDKGNIWIGYIADQYQNVSVQILDPQQQVLFSKKEYLGDKYLPQWDSLKLKKNRTNKSPILVSKNQQKHSYIYQSEKGIIKLPKNFKAYTPDRKSYWISDENTAILKNNNSQTIDRFSIPNFRINAITYFSDEYLFLLASNAQNNPVLIKKRIKESTYEVLNTTHQTLGLEEKVGWLNGKIYAAHKDSILTFELNPKIMEGIRSIFLDNEKNIWIGTHNGFYILSYKKNPFTIYFKDAISLNSYSTRGIWANNDFLYSFAPKGLLRWDFEKKEQEAVPFTGAKIARRTSSRYPNRQLWVGANRGFPLEQIDTLTGEVLQSLDFKSQKSPVWSILENKKEELWIGVQKGGLYQYRPSISPNIEAFDKYNGFDDLKKSKIIHIVEDRKDPNYLWVAAQAGWFLVHTDKGIISRFSSESNDQFKIPSNDIYYTYQDKEGVYWLGTAFGGLLRITLTDDFKIKNVRQFTNTDGFSSKTIYGIFEDKAGFLWLSSNNGIIKFNKSTFELQIFLMEDGLSHYEFNRNSSFQRADGTIFFGTLNGIVSFHPENIEIKAAYDIPLKISKCEKYSKTTDDIADITKSILTKNKIVLQPDERFFTLSVSLQDYPDASKLKYAYKIIGLQNDFTITKDNKITLSGLPYGGYVLHIKGKGKDSRFSLQELKIPLVVLRPFYLTWWFVSLAILTLAFSIWQFLGWRVKNFKNRQLELEQLVVERTYQIEKDKALIEEQATKLEALDKIKSRFFANISHELRTPLTLILSPINTMMDSEKLDNRNYTYAALIQQNAKKLLKRINEILDLTKLEAHEMQLKPTPTRFYTFTKRLVATFESFAQQKKQELSFKYNLDKDLQILLDQDKFEHIFNNYLSNAIKYVAKNGKIEITLSETTDHTNQNNRNQIVLAVKDTGIGIPKEDLENVFDRFYQAKNENNKIGGTGIGLALCREIAELMNGSVDVESVIGQGSTFYFQMPYREYLGSIPFTNEPSVIKDIPNPIIDIETSFNSDKPSILLVEDNTQLRQYIQLILSDKYNITTAENGQEALEKLLTMNCELIISDIMMPVMDGLELLEQLKSNDKWRDIPVIMLTARTNTQTRLDALRIGVDDYLLKPFEKVELIARIENILKNIKQRQVTENQPIHQITNKNTQENKEIVITESDTKWLHQVEIILKEKLSNSKFNAIELSNVLNISRRQLQRRIKKTTGLTPAQYIKESRLQAARSILESGELQTVNEITFAVGFDTAWYFSKQYETRFGKKPIEYLK